jgi:three-Cys-motif partner protein
MGKDPKEYLQERIEGLTENSDSILEQAPEVTNGFNTWSALKLILQSATVNMYTSVLSSTNQDFYYIDGLAGSGVSTYDEDQCFVGSPIVALKAMKEPFSKMYFIEKDAKRKEALEKRLNYVFSRTSLAKKEPESWDVIQGDVNEEISEVVSDIYDRSNFETGFNYLCFLDNEGMDANWETIEELTPKPYGDLLINLPTSQGVSRNVTIENPQSASKFYGLDFNEHQLPETGLRPYLRNLYLERLSERNRGVQCSTQIDANVGSYYYDMIYATRRTDGGSEYVEVIEYVKEFIEKVHAGDVDILLDIIENNQAALDSYLPDKEIEDEMPDRDLPPDQSSLSEW